METRSENLHLGPDDIARLLEGGVSGDERARMLAHLEKCRPCVERYLDSAVKVGFLNVGGHASALRTGQGAEDGAATPAHVTPGEAGGGGHVRASASDFWSRWRLRTAAVTASIVVIIAGGWYGTRIFERSRGARVSAEVLDPIRAAVGEFSRVGEIVLPGGEWSLGESGPVFRSSGGGVHDSLDVPLRDLVEKFLSGGRSPDAAYWLVAGYLSGGDVRMASTYVAAAIERFPADRRLRVLDAAVAYFDGDLARSERLLRDVVKSHLKEPLTDPLVGVTRVNLAIVLREQGKAAEAGEILSEVRARFAGTPIGERAGEIAARLAGDHH